MTAPMTASETTATTSGRESAARLPADVVGEDRPGEVRQVPAEDQADDDRDEDAERERPSDMGVDRGLEGEQDSGQGRGAEDQQAEEDPPADRAEDPLAEEQRQPDPEQEDGEDRGADGDPDEDRGALRGVADLLELGPRQLDVRVDQPLRRVTGRADLLAQAGGGLGTGRRSGRSAAGGRAAAGGRPPPEVVPPPEAPTAGAAAARCATGRAGAGGRGSARGRIRRNGGRVGSGRLIVQGSAPDGQVWGTPRSYPPDVAATMAGAGRPSRPPLDRRGRALPRRRTGTPIARAGRPRRRSRTSVGRPDRTGPAAGPAAVCQSDRSSSSIRSDSSAGPRGAAMSA